MKTPSDLSAAVDAIAEDVIAWRHHIHANPELSNREVNTAKYIVDHLQTLDLDEIHTDIAGHGIVGVLNGGQEGERTILLRADIDALPVPDESGVDFASTVIDEHYPGGPFPVSHACGHDCHTAMLMGAASVLAKHRDQLPGRVLFVFQPAEEGPPIDEEGGARSMLESGIFEKYSPTMAFGMHVQPFPKGVVAMREGNQFGASCLVKITLTGEQVHGSTPWAGIDPMPAVGAILTGIGQIYRQVDAFDPFTVTIGHIEDVGRFNIIGQRVTLWGTIRSHREATMSDVQERVRTLAAGAAKANNCQVNVEYLQDVPAVTNTPEWVAAARPTIERVIGSQNLIPAPPTLGYDDVSEFVKEFGGLYIGLGVQDTAFTENGELYIPEDGRGGVPNHNPRFYADDATLATGVKLMVECARDHLTGQLMPGQG
ncbi:M20 metallopeptidase family protein [Dermatophilus congolensis]|uniref:N-acetyldiaminopimelate deacetylase n=1 Tax=Dermatophilus congolensis TaxID=1863 RepID=A0AA46BNT8_9MICO|nr:amidohydrolase [Dermatophilus congolensis]MBO3143290.1 amidohydrolase [Dermatophilus congolensis]MBO3152277.1 amidohydrolase [Dermatophilus congolensis]MBO3160710.1 amidohydrolase [Dermatophilus congolensis]MBO3163566.1 amidohydrolase [Dermatophilus congolensis]MBO3177112.1 amidohydrolase [Dermatophilus congolensis]